MATNKEILRTARKKIANDEWSYICHAINFGSVGTTGQRLTLCRWIISLLDGPSSYESWLRNNHPKIFKQMKPVDILEGRLQWLDWMIENYNKG